MTGFPIPATAAMKPPGPTSLEIGGGPERKSAMSLPAVKASPLPVKQTQGPQGAGRWRGVSETVALGPQGQPSHQTCRRQAPGPRSRYQRPGTASREAVSNKDRWHQLADAVAASNMRASDKSVFRFLLDKADWATAELPPGFTPDQ